MVLKRVLLLVPLVLIGCLLQSYLWVPTYDKQATGNPDRLVTYIEASIGDAKILNPILNADSASSNIVSHVFEGLLDLDENLDLRGRLATDWTITEKAYLLVNSQNRFPDGQQVTGRRLLNRIKEAMSQGLLLEIESHLQSLALLPAHERVQSVSVRMDEDKSDSTVTDVPVSIEVPERLEFKLDHVDQDLFDRLKPIIGDRYFKHFPHEQHVKIPLNTPQKVQKQVIAQYEKLLPVGEHNPEILFHLRKGVKFHDGHEFDAGDVKFTYEAIMNPKNLSPRTSDFEPIKFVKVIDLYTVRVVYKRLFSPAIYAWTMGILPEHLLNGEAMAREVKTRRLSQAAAKAFGIRDSQYNRHPIGTGRFRFSEWQGDEFIHLTRLDDYWEGPSEYRDYYMRIIPDILTQEMEFLAGAVDFYAAQPHQVARYKKDTQYQSFSSLGAGYTYIGYNNRKSLFAEREIRRALGMAINVGDLLKYLLYGEGVHISGPYPKNTDWYDQTVAPLPYDPEGAQRILKDFGWHKNPQGWLEKDGKIFEFNLITNSGNPIRKNVMTITQNAWKKIGVKCNTQYFEWAVFLKDFVYTGEFDAVVLGWGGGGINPDLFQVWHSSQAGPQQLNFVGYKNKRADDLIVRIRREYNLNRQRALAHQLHGLIHQDQPYTFLFSRLSTIVLDKKIVLVNRMEDGSEKYARIYPIKSGDINYYFHKWRKLEFTPDF